MRDLSDGLVLGVPEDKEVWEGEREEGGGRGRRQEAGVGLAKS